MSRPTISPAHLVQHRLGAGAPPPSQCQSRSTLYARVRAQWLQLLAQMAVR